MLLGVNKIFLTKRVPLQRCPTCDTLLDAATSVNHTHDAKPKDATVCINCGNILQFDGEMNLKVVDVNELKAQPPEVLQAIFEVQQAVFQRIIERANG